MHGSTSFVTRTIRAKGESIRAGGCALLLAVISSCVHAAPPAAATREESSAVLLTWNSRCTDEEGKEDFFQIRIKSDGLVHFKGGSSVHEKNEQSAQIAPLKARRLIRNAKDSIEQDAQTSIDSNNIRYCIAVELPNRTSGRIPVSIEQSFGVGAILEQELRRTLKIASWLCPTRVSELQGTSYCPQELIAFEISEYRYCKRKQAVRVFADGTIHQFVSDRVGSGDDQYSKIAERDVEQLVNSTKPYVEELRATSSPPEPAIAGRPTTRYFHFSRREDVLDFKRRLFELAQLKDPRPQDSEGCPAPMASYPTGSIAVLRKIAGTGE